MKDALFFIISNGLSTVRFLISLAILLAAITIIIKLGENALGFDLRKAIDRIEEETWPVTILIVVGMLCITYVIGGFGH